MEPFVVGAAVTGGAVWVIYRLAKHQSAPASRAGAGASRPPKKSWLVKAYNASGARPVDSDDLRGASAEFTGRAVGAAGRRSRRRWRIIADAAERSRTRRETRWSQHGRPHLFVHRDKNPAARAAQGRKKRRWARLLGKAARKRRTDAKNDQASQPSPPVEKPQPAPPTETPERHLRAVPDPDTTPGEAVTTTADTTPTPTTLITPEAPPDWALIAERIRNFNPDDDNALLAFMRGESVGVLAYAEAMEQARDNCVNDVGLDPSAVQGFTAYSEHVSDAAARMSEAYKTFVAVYGEVLQLAANGVVMPYKGRFFTGGEAG
jgi:hypothetical protein